jgi:hypothetical protein
MSVLLSLPRVFLRDRKFVGQHLPSPPVRNRNRQQRWITSEFPAPLSMTCLRMSQFLTGLRRLFTHRR